MYYDISQQLIKGINVMGLDMFLTGRKYVGGSLQNEEYPFQEMDGKPVESIILDLGVWRKHSKLHGYIVKNFAHNGEDDCQKIELTEDDLKRIVNAIRNKDLPKTEGCFFGNDEIDEMHAKDKDENINKFEDAIKWLGEHTWKHSVYYQASW